MLPEVIQPQPCSSDPIKNTLIHVQSAWQLQGISKVNLGEILLLQYKFSDASLLKELSRLHVECLIGTSLLCRNPVINTIYNISDLENISNVSLNTILCLKMPRTTEVNKHLHNLNVSLLNQNYYAKINRIGNIRNVDRTEVKDLLQRICADQQYGLADLCNMTKLGKF